MNYVSDFLFDTFLYFRLGNKAEKSNRCMYASFYIGDDISVVESNELLYDELPAVGDGDTEDQVTRICVISDTHERHHLIETPVCDILIHAGDILMTSRFASKESAKRKFEDFNSWLAAQPARHRLVVAGNHDKMLERMPRAAIEQILSNAEYLCNDIIQCEGLQFFGTPVSRGHSENKAFQSEEFWGRAEDALQKLNDDGTALDVIITHGPCKDLARKASPRLLHISGHLHKNHGIQYRCKGRDKTRGWWNVCAPLMGHRYTPVQTPIVVDIRHRGAAGNGGLLAANQV